MSNIFHMDEDWEVIRELGRGAFGVVYEVKNGSQSRALKVLRGAATGWRDMLVNDIPAGPFALPILDSTESGGEILLLMPLAERSLRDAIEASAPFAEDDAIAILGDLAAALTALADANIVHRDIKPDNILFHDGTWKLSDFGEAKYADATTSGSTHRMNMTPEYAAPERWWDEKTTSKTDVYSLGVIAYELLAGVRPFPGPRDQLRDQHLNTAPPELSTENVALRSLIKLTLAKSPDARLGAHKLRRGLQALIAPVSRPGFEDLRAASAVIAEGIAKETLEESRLRILQRRHDGMLTSAAEELTDLASEFATLLMDNAVAAHEMDLGGNLVRVGLGAGELSISPAQDLRANVWAGQEPNFELVATAEIRVSQAMASPQNYRGRVHSLWYADVHRKGEFAWFEVAFTDSNQNPSRNTLSPLAWTPDDRLFRVLQGFGQADVTVVRPFQTFDYTSVAASASEWGSWLAQAAANGMRRPVMLPESNPQGSWRRVGAEEASQLPAPRL